MLKVAKRQPVYYLCSIQEKQKANHQKTKDMATAKLTKATKFEVIGSTGKVIAVFKVKSLKADKKVKADKIVTVEDIRNNWDKNADKVRYNYNAEINLTQKTIRIFGIERFYDRVQAVGECGSIVWKHTEEDREFSKVFAIGSIAEYDSYNLRYTAEISNITASYVEFSPRGYSKKTRLKLAEFIRRNYKLDLEKLAAENAETRMYI